MTYADLKPGDRFRFVRWTFLERNVFTKLTPRREGVIEYIRQGEHNARIDNEHNHEVVLIADKWS